MQRIALVPGFLGFDHRGELTYFADRFIAGLRASLEARLGHPVSVTPVAVPAIGNLKARQDALLQALAQIDPSGECAWHLVGHSTGGLDAALLLREHRLGYTREAGSFFSSEPLDAPEIRSVTTIAAPHYGSCITRSPGAKTTRAGVTIEERLEGLLALPELAVDAAQRDQLLSRIRFGRAAAGRSSLDFFWHLLLGNDLLRDLDPAIAAKLTETPNVRSDAPVFSIATMAPDPAKGLTSDNLFMRLWQWTQVAAAGAEPKPPALREPALRIAKHDELLPKPIAELVPGENDGVVNTDRQVYGTFAGLVSADHCDVLGRYRRTDAEPVDGVALGDDSVLDPGLLTSGSEFGDDQFFSLIRLIAQGIVGAKQKQKQKQQQKAAGHRARTATSLAE
jgi:pimeloyl-ACP methyl ester carboxylesterase